MRASIREFTARICSSAAKLFVVRERGGGWGREEEGGREGGREGEKEGGREERRDLH
mgnify:CR=1 FL=1